MKKLVFNLLNLARNVFSGRWLSFTWRCFARCLRIPLLTRLFSTLSSIAPSYSNIIIKDNNNSDANNSIVLTLDGPDAINFGFLFKKFISEVPLYYHGYEVFYLSSISILPSFINNNKNMLNRFDFFDPSCLSVRFNSDYLRSLVVSIIKCIELSGYSPEHVTVTLTISVCRIYPELVCRNCNVSPGRFSTSSSTSRKKMLKLSHNNSFSTNAPSNNNNSFVITLDGAEAVNYDFVFKELRSVLSKEEKYLCYVSFNSKINNNLNYMFEGFDSIGTYLRFNSGCVRQLVMFIADAFELSEHSPEEVTVVLTFNVASHDYVKEFDSSIQYPGDDFRPEEAIDVFMVGVDAIDYDHICEQLDGMLCPGGTYKGFVGVLHKEKGSKEIFEPFHWKYIMFHYNTESIAGLVDLIYITIKETRGSAEDLDVVLSFWGYDGGSSGSSDSSGGGGGGLLTTSCETSRGRRKMIKPHRNNRKSRLIGLQSVRYFSSSARNKIHSPNLDSIFNSGGIDNKLSLYTSALIDISNILNDFSLSNEEKQYRIEELLFNANLKYLKNIDKSLSTSPKTLIYLESKKAEIEQSIISLHKNLCRERDSQSGGYKVKKKIKEKKK